MKGHHLEVVVRFVDIDRIIDHHCLEIVVRFDNISRIIDHHCLEKLLLLVELLTITV